MSNLYFSRFVCFILVLNLYVELSREAQQPIIGKDRANERQESLLSFGRVQPIFGKVTKKFWKAIFYSKYFQIFLNSIIGSNKTAQKNLMQKCTLPPNTTHGRNEECRTLTD